MGNKESIPHQQTKCQPCFLKKHTLEQQQQQQEPEDHKAYIIDHLLPQFRGVNLANKSFPSDKNARICIIGAGACGLTTAHALKKAGYTNITIYERDSEVGGKGKAVPDDRKQDLFQGLSHDIGTTSIGPTYYWIRNLIDEVTTPDNGVAVVTPDVDSYRVYTNDPDLKEYLEEGQDYIIGLKKWLLLSTEHEVLPKEAWFLPSTAVSTPTIIHGVSQYKEAVKSVFGELPPHAPPYTFPVPITDDKLRDIDMPFSDFVARHCPGLKPVLLYGSHTYGHMTRFPTFYALYFLSPEIINEWVSISAHYPSKAYIKNGWTHFWNAVVEYDELNVVLNANVESIVRTEDKVVVTGSTGVTLETSTATTTATATTETTTTTTTTTGGGGEGRVAFEKEFDFLFVACPPTKAALQLDWREQELDLFSKLEYCIMTSTLVEVDPSPIKEHVQLMMTNICDIDKYYTGNPLAIRDAYRSLVKDMKDIDHPRRLFAAQVNTLENFSLSQVNDNLRRFFQDYQQSKHYSVLYQKPFDYFYHFPQSEINNRCPWKVLDLQGTNRTAFVHGAVSFESINETVSYANMVTDFLLSVCRDVEETKKILKKC